jgi:hypothetical protein
VFGSVSATRFGIMKGTFEDGLPRPSSTRPVGSLSLIRKVLASLDLEPGHERHQLSAGGVLSRPALDRDNAVLGGDRLLVMPDKAVTCR